MANWETPAIKGSETTTQLLDQLYWSSFSIEEEGKSLSLYRAAILAAKQTQKEDA